MLQTLHVHLLGDFRLVYGEQPVTSVESPRLQSLLAYLLLHRAAPQSRHHLAFLLFPDSTETQARTNLRNLLHLLRHTLPDPILFLTADVQTLQWKVDAPFTLDVDEFEKAVEQASTAASLRQAVNLYRGELLPGCYDDWILPEREHLQQKFIETLERLILLLENQRDFRGAISYAERLLRQDPLREETYRHLMRLHALSGDRAGVARYYNTCVTVLKSELAVEPSLETREAYEQLLKLEVTAVSQPLPRVRSNNLPIPLTSFIGRQREMADIKRLLSTTRPLTLVGAGGCGKTRLALAVAGDLVSEYADGVWLVDLAPLTDAALVPQAIASALDVREQPAQPIVNSLRDYLRHKQMLLVMDNCEHLITACAHLAEILLQAAPDLKILATSRETLGIAGERTMYVPSLAVPDVRQLGTSSEDMSSTLLPFEAVQLFVARASVTLPTFTLTHENAASVAQVCHALDGIPLAIELAAARLKVLSVPQIAARLNDRFSLLTSGSRTALPRHQTLRAALDWSFDLLPESERKVFRRLSVFAGGFTLAAVEQVCSSEDIKKEQALDLLARLVDKSLVVVGEQAQSSEVRYRLLDTIREYAREKLVEANEIERMRSHHLDYFLEFAEKAESELGGSKRIIWFNREETEFDNIRAAFESSRTVHDGTERGLRLAGALYQFWGWRSHQVEGARWLERMLADRHERGSGSAAVRAKALLTAGTLAYLRADYALAGALLEASAALCRQLGDKRGLGYALMWLAHYFAAQGDLRKGRALAEETTDLFREVGDRWALAYALGHHASRFFSEDETVWRSHVQESLALFEELGDKWSIEVPLMSLGHLMYQLGNYAEARSYHERFLTIAHELDDTWGLAAVYSQLGDITVDEGNYNLATPLYEASLRLWRNLGIKLYIGRTLINLGQLATHCGDDARANILFTESLHLLLESEQTDARWLDYMAFCLGGLAAIWATSGQPHKAATLLGAIKATMEAIQPRGSWHPPQSWNRFGRSEYDRTVTAVQASLDEATFATLWAEGRAMTMEQAIQYALEQTTS